MIAVVAFNRPAAPQPLGPEPITAAERRVLGALLEGLSNKAIAARLFLSPRTVESHISHLLLKTGCGNRTQLLLWTMGER